MKQYWTPDNIIALIIVVGCLTLLLCGINSEVKSILAIAATWSFRGAYITKKNR